MKLDYRLFRQLKRKMKINAIFQVGDVSMNGGLTEQVCTGEKGLSLNKLHVTAEKRG